MFLEYFTDNKETSYLMLHANPEFYDYYHEIKLMRDGWATIADGGSQCSYGVIKGNFKIVVINKHKIEINFFNLTLFDPYDDNIEFTEIEPCKVMVNKKETNHKFNKAYDEKQYLFKTYYEFEYDPCSLFREYSACYSDKYIPKLEDGIYLYEKNPENYSKNCVYFNELETKYYLDIDERIIE